MELPKNYLPEENEDRIYALWEQSGFFNPDKLPGKRKTPFSIVLPPPNVTGTLHMGHAAMLAIQDILIRFERMRGKKTLWLPGTDHAAIATQSKVEKEISKREGKSRYDLGREEFLKRVETFARESHDTIVNQVRKMGSSVDWSREAFTLDDVRNIAVRTAFKRMYDAGLIYRANRIVNWDPKGQTTISDDEVVYEERDAKLYTFRYVKDFPIAIATTRPETKVGDTAVAVHPDDPRYKKHVGKEYKIEFAGIPLSIKIVADSAVDPKFGTGAVGVTPAHSQTDAEIASRHNLPTPQVIDERAKMMVQGELNGKKISEAREIIIDWLKKENLLEKEEAIKQNVATAERTGAIVEPLPKLQWFVNVNAKFKLKKSKIKAIKSGSETTLKELLTAAVKNGDIKITPDHFEKIYFHWIENLRDWCISRQIWYGHRIPVWYCKAALNRLPLMKAGCKEPTVSVADVAACPACGGAVEQDPDTLDTWFSSGLWTFSTLGWPNEKSKDLKNFHPTSVLETGYDIIFFWVARMILMTGFLLGDIPFRNVYLHGMVRDEQGRKMSKSLGNSIDPLTMVEKYGADATRLSLIIGAAPGADIKLSENRVRGYKHFTNKIWNATRFALMNTADFAPNKKPAYTEEDKKVIAELAALKKEVSQDIEDFRLHLAGEKLYQYFWHTFADKIIESAKPRLVGSDLKDKAAAQALIVTILVDCLKMLHPFVPFVTETIWQNLPASLKGKNAALLITAEW